MMTIVARVNFTEALTEKSVLLGLRQLFLLISMALRELHGQVAGLPFHPEEADDQS